MGETIKAKTQEELNREIYLDGVEFMRPEFIEKMAMPNEANREMKGMLQTNDYDAADTVTIYGALSTYLTILAQQPEKDLETIARVTRLMIAIKPQAVEASQEIARRDNNGT